MNRREAASTGIRLDACAKTFPDGTVALSKVDLEVAGGETVVLLGPSGCGKTTTLRIIAGLEAPDPGGRVFFNDEDVTELPIEGRNVGMVFQSYALFPNMNVAENIAYGLTVRKTPPAEKHRRVEEMFEMMHIGELAERRVDQLSGGQRQRVALARAIAVRPRILLLDEPLTALDAALRERLRVEIDGLLRGLGITAVYVTHDQGEAMAIGDRVVVMDQGVVAQIGKPKEIYFRPANAFVADFIGTSNKLRGRARDGRLHVAGGSLCWRGPEAEALEVMFRPEDARIVPLGEADLKGRILQAYFLGNCTKIILGGVGEETVIVETAERGDFEAGADLGLRIDSSRLFVVD